MPPSDELPGSGADLLASLVSRPLFSAMFALVALLASAILYSFLPVPYTGAGGVLVALVACAFFAATVPCPHCGGRNLRF